MKASPRIRIPAALCLAVFAAAALFALFVCAGAARAQAPAGPMPAHPEADAPPPQAPSQSAHDQATSAKIAGTWKLNKDQSDDARKAMQAASGGQSGSRGGWGGSSGGGWGGSSGGGWGGGGGRGGRGGYGGRGGDSSGGMLADYNQLTIAQSGSAVKISGSSGHVLAQSPSAQADDKSKSNDSRESVPAGEWQGSQYVVTTQNNRGKTTRTYALSQDSSQLTLTTRIDSPRFDQPVTLRYVYDPVKGSNGAE